MKYALHGIQHICSSVDGAERIVVHESGNLGVLNMVYKIYSCRSALKTRLCPESTAIMSFDGTQRRVSSHLQAQ